MDDRHPSPPPPSRIKGDQAPSRSRRTLFTLCLAVLVAQIDTSVVNLAVRPIGVHFSASVAQLQWVVDSYNLVYASLLLTGGLLADLYGRRLTFMLGTALFTAASLLCAAAPTVNLLIAGRAMTGLGSALMLPASLAIIRIAWPDPARRGRALGVWAGCNGAALAIGPTLGGFLVASHGWRSVFLIVVPLGAAALALAMPTLDESRGERRRSFDGPGHACGILALGGLALAAIEMERSWLVAAALLVLALLSLAGFACLEARQGARALVPLDMFRLRAFRAALGATAGMTFGMYGALFLVPLTWQGTGRLSSAEAGVALLPMALAFVLVSPRSAAWARRHGERLLTSGGVATIGAGLLLLAMTAGARSLAWPELGLVLTGIGMGCATGPLMGMAVSAVAAERAGTAGSLVNVARMAGATLGVAVLGTLYGISDGGYAGLRDAMLAGGLVPLAGALAAWIGGRR
ncbi:MFS transporter [Pigmentiphaga sp. NML080357]|uniref:MFS transporter n=1 Tax=Pigmentiphaga sp. NML080357 TaxID=2008675 RepID=UPI000B41EDC5|nr:MFS transporter [Pigmentiphaga sp. NML080357]OVZ57199.1 MFS transporter [Pigmentiphaga sp. NML080357]